MFAIQIDSQGIINPCVFNKINGINERARWAVIFSSTRFFFGMSQNNFAKSLGMGQSYLSYVERGERIPAPKFQKSLYKFIKENFPGGAS